MPGVGTKKRPAMVRVRTWERAQEILAFCTERNWQVVVGVEEDKPEDISDVERLLAGPLTDPVAIPSYPTRNGPCPCGSGRKYKNCCAW